MWAVLIAGNLSVILQALAGLDSGGRAHGARLRHQLLCVPARVIRHARGPTLRLPPGTQLLPKVLVPLRALRCRTDPPAPPRARPRTEPTPAATSGNLATPDQSSGRQQPSHTRPKHYDHRLPADPGQNTPTGVGVNPGNTRGRLASGKRAAIASDSTLR